MTTPTTTAMGPLPGISRAIRDINAQITSLAQANERVVFITGEPGTERALAARILHHLSPRGDGKFLRVTANWKLPPDFAARLREADGGTVFVNLIREFPVDMQYTLLELAMDNMFTDPQTNETHESDVLLVLTTTMDLETLSSTSQLLPELRDLMAHSHIDIPPLRERREDIPPLVRFAVQRARETGQCLAESVDRRVLALFRAQMWPGNAEELLLVAAQAALKATGPVITLMDLPEDFITSLPADTWNSIKSLTPPPEAAAEDFRPISAATPAPTPEETESPSAVSASEEPTLVGAALDVDVLTGAATPPPTPVSDLRTEKGSAERPTDAATDAGRVMTPETEAPTELAFSFPSTPSTRPGEREKPAAAVETEGGPSSQSAQEILRLATRLHSQTAVLARQMEGPLPHGIGRGLSGIGAIDHLDLLRLEDQLLRSLDQILELRRKLAILNERERESAATIRDLLLRLELTTTPDPKASETSFLANQLAEVDAIIERITARLPEISRDIQENIRKILKKNQ